MDANAPGDLARGRHCALPLRRATKRVDDALEFGQQSITAGVEDAATMPGYVRVHYAAPNCPQVGERPFLIHADQPGVAGDIGCQNRREPPLDPVFAHPVGPRNWARCCP